jgi:predicted nucleic acid-binding protein
MDAVVDASVWVSRWLPQDANHETSRRWLEQYVLGGKRAIAPVLLIMEVAGAVGRRTAQPQIAHDAVGQLLLVPNLRLVPVDRRLGMEAARLAGDLGLRGADAMYVTVAYRLGIPLVTWDVQQRERASSLIVAYTPDDL